MLLLVPAEEYSRQCIHAAYSSRLNPFALHVGECQLFKTQISGAQKVVYLSIRNGILRLWTRNPLVGVSKEEALGCAKESRHQRLASVVHEWLLRNGYINFGCVDFTSSAVKGPGSGAKQKTIIIIGAGISGLACARQLHGLFKQFQERWTMYRRERLPRVIILEGRNRIGGRVYSHPLKTQRKGSLTCDLANTAETGAQIVTGFDHGNPLDAVIRGQLALEYHPLKDNMLLYDFDGSIVEEQKDKRIQALFNDILEIVSVHNWNPPQKTTYDHVVANVSRKESVDLDERLHAKPECNGSNLTEIPDVDRHLTLGALMDRLAAEQQVKHSFSAQDMRLINWHYANMEYANAVNVDQLSLGGWDQDSGNEFEGRHSEIIGGYSQVARALWKHPQPLDVRLRKEVKQIKMKTDTNCSRYSAQIECVDGEIFGADYVVSTLPLGVLQHEHQMFDPPLPAWKQAAMQRLGYGVLNKIILVFNQVFWDQNRDMFGLLNLPDNEDSLVQEDYVSGRGKCYLFWNCVKTSGQPMLVALMAGDAARDAEDTPDEDLVEDVTKKLAKMFSLQSRPIPSEVIVTRWKKDPFARGSYSYLGPMAQPGDYDAMAHPVGDLFFAGEATCGTHPATVHGAYLSGLRAASEMVEVMIGAIPVPADILVEA